MLVRVGPRQTGRSSWAVDMLERNPYHSLVVFNAQEARRIETSHEFLVGKNRVHSWTNLDKIRFGTRGPLIIDNVDMLIRDYFGPLNVDIITIEGILV